MNKTSKQHLKQFQCEEMRIVEEEFAITFSENPACRLFFINEDSAYTDGTNIVVDPATHDTFCNTTALHMTENYFKISQVVSKNEMLALAMITRGQNIHECLHILYSNFPGVCADPTLSTRFQKRLVALISNIIEDTYIENYAATQFDEVWHRLKFNRIALAFSEKEVISSVDERIGEVEETERWLPELLNYMIVKYIYPFFECKEPSLRIKEYVDKTDSLFAQATANPIANQRDAYAIEIYQQLKPYIIEKEELLDEVHLKLLPGNRSHDTKNTSINMQKRKGKDGPKVVSIKYSPKEMEWILHNSIVDYSMIPEEKTESDIYVRTSHEVPCSPIHKDITIYENHIHYDIKDKKAYDTIVAKNQLLINNLSGRMRKQLKETYDDMLNKQRFGKQLNSRYFSDVKKRYWDKSIKDERIMDLSIMILVDGSASMEGKRKDETLKMMIVLHEVLEKNKIPHCIVEHKAIFMEPVVLHNVLLDFHHKKNDQYSLLQYDPNENTREGVTLSWVQYYFAKHMQEGKKLVLVIADGMPYHNCDGMMYEYPENLIDTHKAYLTLKKQGIATVGIALDDCYEQLIQIYDNVINCKDVSVMCKQMFRVILKEIM